MSCQLNPFAWFDTNAVKKRLFPDRSPEPFDSNWGWTEDLGDDSSNIHSDTNYTWLQDCLAYLSPSREILLFAKDTNVVILTSKWESQKKHNLSSKYVVLWSGNVQQEKTENITSVLCLPLASVGRSSHHGADWTCIVLGFTSGNVRFYTENGNLMISELFHEGPVLHLKCQSYRPSSYPGELEHQEELLITYHNAVVSLNGFALFQTLRGCRSHLARVKANCGEEMKSPPLAYKKWGFTGQRISSDEIGVSDCEVIGPSTPHTFDHLHQQHIMSSQLSSTSGYKTRAPATSMVVATGGHPFVGFHYSTEGSSRQIIYHDVARAVTDRLKETLSHTVSSWIFGGQSVQEKLTEEKASIEPAEPIECRFGLCDPLRRGDNIVMTPNRKLSAVTDNLGRIILIDNFKGIAVRLWKGYRDARCGWMEVFEEVFDPRRQVASHGGSGDKKKPSALISPSNTPECLRMAHFLIIHCPRSSLLHVLSTQKGSKIATITTAKGTRFLYISHGIVGTNNVPHKKKRGYVESSCVLIEPNGFLREVVVPFHFALSEESSEKVRDFHLIRRLKKALRSAGGRSHSIKKNDDQTNENDVTEEICSLIRELRCNESLILALHTISTHRHTNSSLFLSAIDVIVQKQEASTPDKSPVLGLWTMCCQLRQLINLYAEIDSSFEGTKGARKEGIRKMSEAQETMKLTEEETMTMLTKNFKMTDFEAKDLLRLVEIFSSSRATKPKTPVVTFEDEVSMSLADFLSCFDLIINEDNNGNSNKDNFETLETDKKICPLPISLKLELQEQNMEQLCYLLFYHCLENKDFPSNWKSVVSDSGICTKDLLSMAIQTWLHYGWKLLGESVVEILQRLISSIQAICTMAGPLEGETDKYCIHSLPWWEDVRNLFGRWESPLLALIGTLACRKVATTQKPCGSNCPLQILEEGLLAEDGSHLLKEEEKKGTTISKEEGWERVSVEGMAWDKLIHNLEDLSYLEAAVSWPLLRSPMTVSLEIVIGKGRGCVSEMVAQWILSCNMIFGPEHWSPTPLLSLLQSSPTNDDITAKEKDSAVIQALDLLCILRSRFPFSLCTSTLIANVSWECARNFTSHDGCSSPVLSNTIEWLQSVPSSRIQRGLCGLLWTVCLEHRLKSGVQLLECYPFMDAIPERVILDEVGLPSLNMLHDLFANIHKFLYIMTELAVSTMEDEEEEEECLRWEEDLWGPEKQMLHQCGGGGPPPPLVELAMLQPPLPPSLDPHRLALFHQLCIILCLISRVHPKGPTSLSQPLSQLFTAEERTVILSSSDSDTRIQWEKNLLGPVVTTSRVSFIKKSISTVCRSGDYNENSSKELIRIIFKAAETFELPMDDIRRHHVCELYSCGHDREAEEIMATVVDKENLASQLLVIVFHRLKHYLDQTGDGDYRSEVVATFSPASLARLQNQLSSYLVCKDIPVRSTEQLLSNVLAYLPEESKLYSEALGILDAVRVIASQE